MVVVNANWFFYLDHTSIYSIFVFYIFFRFCDTVLDLKKMGFDDRQNSETESESS